MNRRLKAVSLGLGLALTALTLRHWWSNFEYNHPPCNNCVADFPQFYAGAKLIWQNPSKLYSYSHQVAIQKALDPRIRESTQPFAYPPFMALVLMPLGWLPFSIAFAVMTLVNAGLLSLALILLIRNLYLTRDQAHWLLLTTLCNFGVHLALFQGQTSIIMLCSLNAFMFAVLGRKQAGAGFWSAVLLFKPQLLPIPMLILVSKKFWQALSVAAVILTILCALSILLVSPQGIFDYLQLLKFYATSESGFGSYPQYMHNLRALVQYYIPFKYVPYFWLAFELPLAAITLWINAVMYDAEHNTAFLWIANFIAIMLLTPHLYPHDLTLMIVPIAFLLKLCPKQVPWFVPTALMILGVFPVWSFVTPTQLPPVIPMILLATYGVSIWNLKRSAQPNASVEATLS